jgi:hypothetical protein
MKACLHIAQATAEKAAAEAKAKSEAAAKKVKHVLKMVICPANMQS